MEIEEKFRELREKKEGAYMPHVYYGDPNEEFSLELIKVLAESGADLLEFGIPFSDPIADGPTFIAACERALRGGMTPTTCTEGIKKLKREGLRIPIVVTTYFNIPYAAGIETFLSRVKKAGGQGIIVPDLPVEESTELLKIAENLGLRVIFQVAPTTNEERLEKIVEAASGFLYVINVEGVTGVRESLLDSTLRLVKKVKGRTGIPLMAGFGISKGKHAAAVVSAGADGVVTGSAITNIYAKNLEKPEKTLPEISGFARAIKQACIDGYRRRGQRQKSH